MPPTCKPACAVMRRSPEALDLWGVLLASATKACRTEARVGPVRTMEGARGFPPGVSVCLISKWMTGSRGLCVLRIYARQAKTRREFKSTTGRTLFVGVCALLSRCQWCSVSGVNGWIEYSIGLLHQVSINSPRYKLRSELALQMTVPSAPLQLTSFTPPLCPGRLYSSSPLATSHT